MSWVVDTSVRSPLKDGVLAGSSSKARHAASLGESEKDRIYSDHCRDIGYQFLPAVFETFGAIGDRLAAHMQSLQCEYVESLGQGLIGTEGNGCVVARWRERLSVTLQNGMCDKIRRLCNALHIPLAVPASLPPVSSRS